MRIIAERRRDLYVVLPIREAIALRARDVQVRVAARGHHRAAGVIDLLTAAVAENHSAVVLHYDADFEHIAAVTAQLQARAVPRGSISDMSRSPMTQASTEVADHRRLISPHDSMWPQNCDTFRL